MNINAVMQKKRLFIQELFTQLLKFIEFICTRERIDKEL
jgi:hypothetical protein